MPEEMNLDSGAGASTPADGSTPVSLDPNGTYVIPGFDTPLKGEQVKGGLLMQADYTRKTQALAQKERELDSLFASAQDALAIAQLLSEDFDGGIETLRPIFMGESNSNGQQQAPQTGGPNVSQQQAIPPEMQSLLNEIRAIRQENEQIKGQLYGFMASNQLSSEWAGLESRDPRLQADVALRAKVADIASKRPGLSLEEAFKIATWEDPQKVREQYESEAKARELAKYIPSLGAGTRPTATPPPSGDDVFRQAFLDSLKEEGYVPK